MQIQNDPFPSFEEWGYIGELVDPRPPRTFFYVWWLRTGEDGESDDTDSSVYSELEEDETDDEEEDEEVSDEGEGEEESEDEGNESNGEKVCFPIFISAATIYYFGITYVTL